MIWLIVTSMWIACSTFAAGTFNAVFQDCDYQRTKKERRVTLGEAWLFGLVGGPAAALVALFSSGFLACGWSLKA